MEKNCEVCGSTMSLRTRLSGEKVGNRYWVCTCYPECRFSGFYAEQGKPGVWKWFLKKDYFNFRWSE